MKSTIADVYQEYTDLCGADGPQRTREEIQTAVQAAGLRYEEVGPDFWDCLDDDWFVGLRPDRPFAASPPEGDMVEANARYRELARIREL